MNVDAPPLKLKRKFYRFSGNQTTPAHDKDVGKWYEEVVTLPPMKFANCQLLTEFVPTSQPPVMRADEVPELPQKSTDAPSADADKSVEKSQPEADKAKEAGQAEAETQTQTESSAQTDKVQSSAKTDTDNSLQTGGAQTIEASEANKDSKEGKGGFGFGLGALNSISLPTIPLFDNADRKPTTDPFAPKPRYFSMSARNLHPIGFKSSRLSLVPSVAVYLTVPYSKYFYPLGDYHESHCPEIGLSVPKIPKIPIPVPGASNSDQPAEDEDPEAKRAREQAQAALAAASGNTDSHAEDKSHEGGLADVDVVNPIYLPSLTTVLPHGVVKKAKEAAEFEWRERCSKNPSLPKQTPANLYLACTNYLFVLTFGYPSERAVAYAEISVAAFNMAIEAVIKAKKAKAQKAADPEEEESEQVEDDDAETVIKLALRHAGSSSLWDEVFTGEDVSLVLDVEVGEDD